ncbi:MAG: proline racemase [Clostridiales bacterium]|nr:proline racemase [Clostridiales bacterium]
MVISKSLKIIQTHTAGSPTKHIVAGAPSIKGATMAEKMAYMHDHCDWIRRITMMEPRGSSNMSGALYTTPCNPEADMGILYFDACDYMTMCGHSTIAVATVLVETGMVEKQIPYTTVKLDTPAGLVVARVCCDENRVLDVTFRNVPSFLYAAKEVETEEFGDVYAEVAFGGMAYAIVSAKRVGVEIRPDNASELSRVAQILYRAIDRQIGFQHPEQPFIDRIHSVMLFDDPTSPDADSKEVVVLIPAEAGNAISIDRSPCGTGTSARVAAEYATGRLGLNEPFVQQSIIETRFTGKIVEDRSVGPYRGGIPEITGAAHFTGFSDLVLDAHDPVRDGFIVG